MRNGVAIALRFHQTSPSLSTLIYQVPRLPARDGPSDFLIFMLVNRRHAACFSARMVNDRTRSGRNCAPRTITATPGLRCGLLLMLLMALSAHASYIDLPTGMPWSVAINGAGYLIVRDPATGLETATRQGYLTLDMNGYLVNFAGLRVQGFSNAAPTTIGDLQVNSAGWPGTNSPPPTLDTFEIQSNGCVVVKMSD